MMDGARIAEADFPFCRVDIEIGGIRIHLEKKTKKRMQTVREPSFRAEFHCLP